MIRRLFPILFLACIPALFALETPQLPSKASEKKVLRVHTSVRDTDQEPLFFITNIIKIDPEVSENLVLIEDETLHERFIYRQRFDLAKKRSLEEFSDDTGKKFIRRSYDVDIAASSKTLPDLLSEARENPKIYELTPLVMLLEAPSFSSKVTEAELKQPKSRRTLIARLRETLEPHFLESLELMRVGGLPAARAISGFYDSLGDVVFHGECAAPENAHEVQEPPDCGFDKAFGFPCSDAQLETIAQAKRDGRTLWSY
jgi:hypothetical protein